jgi:hypothetical protein
MYLWQAKLSMGKQKIENDKKIIDISGYYLDILAEVNENIHRGYCLQLKKEVS